ncbi:MAG: PAS domain S-box protein [Bdellovibrionales bacterium]|nr:PAS domain S-box protein [Bdellovibrionales bacterium]
MTVVSFLLLFVNLTIAVRTLGRTRDVASVVVVATLILLNGLSLTAADPSFELVQMVLATVGLVAVWQIAERKSLAESGLRQTEDRFSTLVGNMPDGFRIVQQGITTYANRRFCEMLGYEEREIVGKSANLVFFDAESEVLQEQRALRLRGISSSYEHVLRKKNGERLPVIVSSQPVMDERGTVVAACGVFTDISSREQADLVVRRSEKRFRDYAAAATDRFWEIDRSLRLTYISGPAGRTNSPFLPDDTHDSWTDFVHAETVGDQWPAHQLDLAERRPFRDLRYTQRTPGSRLVHWRLSGLPLFDEDGEFLGYRGTAADVTGEVEALERATKAQTVLMSALNSISEAFAVFDADDRLVLFNNRFAEIFPEVADVVSEGMRFEEMLRHGVARGLYEFSEAEGGEEFIRRRMQQHREPVRRLEQRLSGNRWVQIIERKMPDGGRVGVWTDVTELKRREQDLVQAQKMEAVGQLTGGIAHDFNNLLAVIMGNLEMLQSRVQDSAQQLFLRRALTGAQRAAALTQRLLTFSRKQRLQPRPTDVAELINGMTDLLRGSLGEAVRIRTTFADEVLWASVDPNQLETALLNLALNARDAMPSGGELTIECEYLSAYLPKRLDDVLSLEPGRIDTGTAVPFIRISVTDSGTGIPKEIRNRLFEPFFTTKDVGRGSGLGLSMVYGFVTQSGGDIEVESEVGRGTAIRLYLPAAHSERLMPEQVSGAHVFPEARGETILVVEDDADVRTLTCEMLREFGYVVLEADEGSKALELLTAERSEDASGSVDLLLADVVLPNRMSGVDLVLQAQQLVPGLRAMFFSGYTRHALAGPPPVGAPLLNKPFRRVELARMVREVLQAPPFSITAAPDEQWRRHAEQHEHAVE